MNFTYCGSLGYVNTDQATISVRKKQEYWCRNPKDLVISEEGVFGNQDAAAKGPLHGGIIAAAYSALKFDFTRKNPRPVKGHEINLLPFDRSPVEDTFYVSQYIVG